MINFKSSYFEIHVVAITGNMLQNSDELWLSRCPCCRLLASLACFLESDLPVKSTQLEILAVYILQQKFPVQLVGVQLCKMDMCMYHLLRGLLFRN